MVEENYKSIKIHNSVKVQLDEVKKKYTYSDYISLMIRYFAVSNISPESATLMPGVDIKQAVERSISIQKAQEKDLFKPILKLLKEVKSGLESMGMKVGENNTLADLNSALDHPLTLDDFNTLVDLNEELKLRLEEEKKEAIQLRESNKKIASSLEEMQQKKSLASIDTGIIKESLELLGKSAKQSNQKRGILEIETTVFDACIDRILSEIK